MQSPGHVRQKFVKSLQRKVNVAVTDKNRVPFTDFMVYPSVPAFGGLLVRDQHYRRPCFVWVVELACSRSFSGLHPPCLFAKAVGVSNGKNSARGALSFEMGHATSPASCTNAPRVQRATRASRRHDIF